MTDFTEEEIRSKIIVPFLTDIGLSFNDLKLETSFSIQLGRGVYNIKNEQKKCIGGRLDILCKIDNKNMFIVELKAENVKIDKIKDSQQGLSYARLMQPMPPYVIVTNGSETYLFDTIYGKEVDKNYIIKNGYFVSIEDDILFRFNAMKNFIGYSFKNLLVFCETISKANVLKFSASNKSSVNDKLAKKYTPSLYVERNGLEEKFSSFLEQSDKNVFAIVGASGCGKTNTILNLFKNLDNNPALFYSGTLLGSSFFEELKFDFNLEFSPQETELTIIKKISLLAEQHNKQFLFFIDAIDEWIANDKSSQLDKIVKITSRYNIKLCLSCKDLLWPSLLNNKDVTTNLSEHLFNTFSIEDFSENEFKEALVNYSSVLKVPITSRQFSRDMYNPFSLRIAFEVSHINKDISLNDNSLNAISLYLNQKLVKSSNVDLCKRYLYSIAEILLTNNTIHENEEKIRELLHININEEIPIDLFSNSLLYRNNIDNRNYIGFYFSKIRDYIISNEILLLNKKNKTKRIETITKSLDSFIGENAVNFYLGNCDSKYLSDSLNALIIYDKKNNSLLTIKLIAQQNEIFFLKFKNEQIELLFSRIQELIKSNSIDYLNHEEINVVLSKMYKHSTIEPQLIELLYLINKFSPNYNVYNICKLLEKYDSVEGTNKLVELVQDKNIETEIRRFALDSINTRNINNRKQIFLSLLNEYIEDKSGPLFYAKYWYNYVEDVELRDYIIDRFDFHKKSILVEILAHSKIDNTGELLFSGFLKNKYPENTTWWLCRTICSLNYKPAIQKFVEIIQKEPESELTGHLLIGLGEMKAQELKPILYDIIKLLPDNYNNDIWLSHAFTGIMEDSDYIELLELANKSKNLPTIQFAAFTLSNRKNSTFNEFILKCVINKNLKLNKRYRIFQEWSNNLVMNDRIDGVKIMKELDSINVLTNDELEQIHSIFKDNNKLSTIALSILLNFENNIDELEKAIIHTLPKLKFQYITSRSILMNLTILKELKVRLNNWLKQNLQLSTWDNKYFLFNCIQFAGLLGDYSHVEIIENNKVNIFNFYPTTVEDDYEINIEKYINHILHIIRVSDNKIRTRLE